MISSKRQIAWLMQHRLCQPNQNQNPHPNLDCAPPTMLNFVSTLSKKSPKSSKFGCAAGSSWGLVQYIVLSNFSSHQISIISFSFSNFCRWANTFWEMVPRFIVVGDSFPFHSSHFTILSFVVVPEIGKPPFGDAFVLVVFRGLLLNANLAFHLSNAQGTRNKGSTSLIMVWKRKVSKPIFWPVTETAFCPLFQTSVPFSIVVLHRTSELHHIEEKMHEAAVGLAGICIHQGITPVDELVKSFITNRDTIVLSKQRSSGRSTE